MALDESPNSAAAMRAAVTEPGPMAVANGPLMSVNTPMRMTSVLISARALWRRGQPGRHRGNQQNSVHQFPPEIWFRNA